MVEQPSNPPSTSGHRSNSVQSSSSTCIAATSRGSSAAPATAGRYPAANFPRTIGRHVRPIGSPARANEYFEPQAKRAQGGHSSGSRPAATAKERPLNTRAAMVAVAASGRQPHWQAKETGSDSSLPTSLSNHLSPDLCEAYAEIDRLEAARGDHFNGLVLRPPNSMRHKQGRG